MGVHGTGRGVGVIKEQHPRSVRAVPPVTARLLAAQHAGPVALRGERPAQRSRKRQGNIFRVGIFLDFVRLATRTMHPHGAYVRGAKRNRVDPHRGGIERLTMRTWV